MDYYHNDHHNKYKDEQYRKFETFDRDTGYNDDVVSIGTWVFVLIVLAIPIINIIALLVLAIGDYNVTLKNFAKASLIVMIFGLLFALLIRGCSYLG